MNKREFEQSQLGKLADRVSGLSSGESCESSQTLEELANRVELLRLPRVNIEVIEPRGGYGRVVVASPASQFEEAFLKAGAIMMRTEAFVCFGLTRNDTDDGQVEEELRAHKEPVLIGGNVSADRPGRFYFSYITEFSNSRFINTLYQLKKAGRSYDLEKRLFYKGIRVGGKVPYNTSAEGLLLALEDIERRNGPITRLSCGGIDYTKYYSKGVAIAQVDVTARLSGRPSDDIEKYVNFVERTTGGAIGRVELESFFPRTC